MDIIIRESQKTEELSIIDPRTGVNYISDFVGNTGAHTDGQFEWDEDKDAYICDQDTFDWWSKVVDDNQKLEDRIYQLREEHGHDAVEQAIGDAFDCDLEDHARAVNQVLDDVFGG